MKIRTYSELIQLATFKERWEYLALRGEVGADTFGFDRFLNQNFYHSPEWRRARRDAIVRDSGCDLGLREREIFDSHYVHHMNPMTVRDLDEGNPDIINLEYLITVSHSTHNAIHYGDENLLPPPFVERKPGDTRLW